METGNNVELNPKIVVFKTLILSITLFFCVQSCKPKYITIPFQKQPHLSLDSVWTVKPLPKEYRKLNWNMDSYIYNVPLDSVDKRIVRCWDSLGLIYR